MKTLSNDRPALPYNAILDTDSYKLSHWNQYPPGLRSMMSYFESRGGELSDCTLFGLQYLLRERIATRITQQMVDEAAAFAQAHGEPFNRLGWQRVVDKHHGCLPVRIRAIEEGTIVPTGHALMTIESTDPQLPWLVNYIETQLVRLWYPSTIAMTSRESRRIIMAFLEKTADDPQAEIPFKLHDFGARGVATLEQSRLGGAAHLLSFMGSDTIEGIRFAKAYYDCDMAGFSIPAAEHSTMTMWGKEREFEAYENIVRAYLYNPDHPEGAPKMAACVSDSYDIYNAIENGWCGDRLHRLVRESGGTLVVRPDSGHPPEVVVKCLQIFEKKIGMQTNRKGYKVLPPYYRLIQGDGIDRAMTRTILQEMEAAGFSASNIAFGSGGGLLQKVDRDTQKWAFKCCSAEIDGLGQVEVRKDPVTDHGKRSKGGRLDLIAENGRFQTIALEGDALAHPNSAMNTVFENGEILRRTTFEQCRERMAS
ncbi:nicotinate phosphoribosyltransferase [Pelagicoccus sp. SDUM812003]|uniref:nicotinate phosphoribosyltransferase n=1 Tax=Pelagicoccus sp. SDUM812003 TaxID=3041267 RepID=UPI00280D147B|nr:nicotinate phosphoribosyltransferase [Pelagicoccus sp. SDUM812003]MDQ8202346.1 nicotinate phosphoribosyltransferase [Pelagicoccus sp. SDUM812003]